MKKFIDLIKKYKIYILSILLLIFFFKSCSKSADIKKLNKVNDINLGYSDSLQNVINYQKAKIDSIPEIIRIDKIKSIHHIRDGY